MNKIYSLVKFKNELASKLEELSLVTEIDNKISLINQLMASNEEFPHLIKIKEIKNTYHQLIEDDQQKINTLKTFIDQLNNEIETLVTTEPNASLYSNKFIEECITQQLILDDTTKHKIFSKISQYSDWHYPGLQILTREKQWIVPMVSCDPLYLTKNKLKEPWTWDWDKEIRTFEMISTGENGDSKYVVKSDVELTQLEEMLVDYPDSYRRRVRLYAIENRDFSVLPQNQFGFILCWDNFDYLTWDIVQKYLRDAFNLLRPGGVFMFSYTNCDSELSALKVDYQAAAYCSSSWLLKSLEEIGYEVINLTDCTSTVDDPELGRQEHPISWAEVRKPGKLTTAKRSQAQGLIGRK